MKKKNKKKLKWTAITIAGLILVAIITLIIAIVLMYGKVHENTEFVDRSGEFSMPEKPNDIIDISGSDISYTEPITDNSKIPVDSPETKIYKVDPIDKNIINILLVGKDVFSNSGDRGRSDSMIVASYNKKRGNITLTSFMRDSLVPIRGEWNRLNATNAFGGVGLTINTINEVFKLDIQYYATIDYTGFEKLVDKMGGITVNVTQNEAKVLNEDYKQNIASGNTTLNGKEALLFSRIRHKCGDDFARTERQRRVITAAINQAFSKDIEDVLPLVNEGLNYVKTNLPFGDISTLLYDFMDQDDFNINSVRIPADGACSNGYYNDMAILNLDFKKNIDILHEEIYGGN